mmetsp:Transcript_11914/g.20140  ORF Transcript_11914/g.20140 Transcript_11914/m.20140 type:complete len:99 (-) Transcript_11914:8-304(-)
MRPNANFFYRAIENMINNSPIKEVIRVTLANSSMPQSNLVIWNQTLSSDYFLDAESPQSSKREAKGALKTGVIQEKKALKLELDLQMVENFNRNRGSA